MAKAVKVAIIGDASGLKAAVDESDGILKGFGDKVKGFAAGFVSAFAFEKVAGFAKDAIGMASDIGESLSKNSIVFKEGADQIAAAAKGAAIAAGISERDYLDLAGTVGVLGKAAGKSGDELGDFTNELLKRASDVASFNNAAGGTAEVVEAFGAALRGEAEPARKFGVLLDDATLRQKALEMGLIKTTKDALTPQQKSLAAYQVIMQQTTDAAGDFARTSDGLANKQRILAAKFANLKTEVGKRLLPVFSALVSFINDKLGPILQALGAKVLPVFQDIISGIRLFVGAFTGAGADTGKLSTGMIDKIIMFGDTARTVFREIVGGIRSFVAAFKAGDGDVTSNGFPGVMERIGYAARLAFNWIKDVGIPAVMTAFNWLKANVPPAVEAVRAAVMVAFEWIKANVVPIVQQVVAYLVEQFSHLVAWVQANWPAISEAIGHVVNAIQAVVKWLVETVSDLWDRWGNNILTMARNIWNAILSVVNAAIDAVRNVIMTVVNLINGDWGKAWDSFKGILRAAWDAMFAIVKMGANNLWQIFQVVWEPFGSALSSVWEWVQRTWDGIIEWFSLLPHRIATAASGLWDGIKDSFRSAINWIIRKWNSLSFTIGGGSFLGVDIPSATLGVPKIPELAKGGIVTGPTLALIGERGPEAVVPLRGNNAGVGRGNTYNITVNTGVGDKSAISREVIDLIKNYERSNGTDWRAA